MSRYASHFSIDNIPFGIASNATHTHKSVATRFENTVIFLDELAKHHAPPSELDASTTKTFSEPYLNPFISLPQSQHEITRSWIQSLLSSPSKLNPSSTSPLDKTTLHLPIQVGDFTDFSCSKDHALNASAAVFGVSDLPPGFEHFPIGYHGRSSTIFVSGTDVVRPKGQFKNEKGEVVFGASKRLDYELEVGAVIREGRKIREGSGEGVSLEEADEWIFGVCLVNDWSARDIQTLEMKPLGPCNGKSFATSVSPWIIPLAALAPFRSAAPPRNPDITLPAYLQDPSPTPSYNLSLSASLVPAGTETATTICESKFSDIYWTLRDLVAQQTVNGCLIRTGDLLATGTVSGGGEGTNGCLMELVRKGGVSVSTEKGKEKRMWLEDGDVLSISASAGEGVGFGECAGKVVPAR